jgi:predicted  nucleic acid-binding Zn-ribbon protein
MNINVSTEDLIAQIERQRNAAMSELAKSAAAFAAATAELARARERIAELEAKLPPEPVGEPA